MKALITRPLFYTKFKKLRSMHSSFQNLISVFQINFYEYLWG